MRNKKNPGIIMVLNVCINESKRSQTYNLMIHHRILDKQKQALLDYRDCIVEANLISSFKMNIHSTSSVLLENSN